MEVENDNDVFLLFGKHHKGPYKERVVLNLISKGELKKDIMLWRSGLKEWTLASDYFSLEPEEFKETKVIVIDDNYVNHKQKKRIVTNKKNSPKINFGFAPFKKIATSLAIIFALGLSIPACMGIMKSFHVSKFNYTKINELLSLRPMMMKVDFAWSDDDQSLYLGLDKSWNGPINIQIESVEGKIVSENIVTMTSQTTLQKGNAIFKEFSFIKGHKIVEGYYHIRILNNDFKGKLVEDNKLVFDDDTYVYGPIYIGKNKLDFKRELSTFNEAVINNKKKFQFELIERLSTLSSLLTHLEDLFAFEVGKINKGSEIENFNLRYSEEVAMIMHGVTLDHRDEEYQIKNEDSKLLKRYDKLTSIGKEVGEKVASVISGVKKMNQVSASNREKLVNDFKHDISVIRKTIDSELSSLKY